MNLHPGEKNKLFNVLLEFFRYRGESCNKKEVFLDICNNYIKVIVLFPILPKTKCEIALKKSLTPVNPTLKPNLNLKSCFKKE
jgi:hypothetical protein